MANAKVKAAREAYRKDKKRNPYGLYIERYMDWHIAIPSNAVEALVGNADFQRATKAEANIASMIQAIPGKISSY